MTEPLNPRLERPTESIKLETILPISKGIPGCLIFASNLWDRDLAMASNDLVCLRAYLGACRDYATERTQENEKKLREATEHSPLTRLYNLVAGYFNYGTVFLTSIVEPLFEEADLKLYNGSRQQIRANDVSNEDVLEYALNRIKDVKKEGSGAQDYLFNVCRDLVTKGAEATTLARERHKALEQLVSMPSVIAVSGKAAESAWDDMKQKGVIAYNAVGKIIEVAYFGGYNYHWRTGVIDVPLELFRQPDEEEVYQFLKEQALKSSPPFDVFVFSGSLEILSGAIERVNREFPLEVGKGLFRKQEPRIKERVFVVTDPKELEPRVDVFGEAKNLFIRGVNYGKWTNPQNNSNVGGHVLLIDPKHSKLKFVIGKLGAPVQTDVESDRWNRLFRIAQGYEFSNGQVREYDFLEREKHERVGPNSQLGESTAHIMTGALSFDVKKAAEEYRKKPEETQISSTSLLRKLVWPLVAAGAAGVGYWIGRVQSDALLNKQTSTIETLVDTIEKSRGSESR